MKSTPNIPQLKEFIWEHARRATEALACYWVYGADYGDNYCYECCEKEVAKIVAENPDKAGEVEIDGGWSTEHDSLPWCHTCGAKLEGSLTDYGSREEIGAYTDGSEVPYDSAEDWDALERALDNVFDDDLKTWRAVGKVVAKARKAERKALKRAYLHSQLPGMTAVRESFLSVLEPRMVQKAPEPSFPMWDELEAYLLIPYEERIRDDAPTKDLERRLFREAVKFLAKAGFGMRGNCVDAPYGGYIWHFAVQIEQERLWNFPEFQAGRTHLSKHPDSTCDSNPYKERSRARSWDCGYILSIHEV